MSYQIVIESTLGLVFKGLVLVSRRVPGMSRVGSNWVRLAPNGTNLGLFKDQLQYNLARRASVRYVIQFSAVLPAMPKWI